MSTVTRNQFSSSFQNGIDLGNAQLKTALAETPVSADQLARLDTNGDGKLTGAEVNGAFKLVDSLDRNGSRHSFTNGGDAGRLFSALKQGAVAGPAPVTPRTVGAPGTESIARAATDRASADRAGYAYDNAPTSPYKNLSGNKVPGETRPGWLKGNNKCNQFVGDALTQAGFKMPTFKMENGSEHYVNAERLPTYTRHFDRVTDPSQIKPGDVFVKDYPATGESTAHTEVITGVDPATGSIKTTGAHHDGAYEMDRGNMFEGFTYNAGGKYWEDAGGNKLYILRPKMPASLPGAPIRG